MQLKRWLTALSLIPILILVIGYGSEPIFFGLVLVTTILAINEFYSLVLPENLKKEKVVGILLGSLLAYIIFRGEPPLILGTLTFIVLFMLVFFLLSFQDLKSAVPSFGKLLTGIFYVGLLFSHLILIREMPFGKQWVFFALTVTFLGDTAAYYGGSSLGKNRLYPKISPGKTIEGSIFGIIGNIVGAFIFTKYFFCELEMYHCLILALGIGIMGQAGDLCESMIKRSVLVKDSGGLLPGHGGILDRIDSILFAAPFLYYYIIFVL
ncbi:MAG: phosphatidate cytidylyltransferase [Thermodesulfobacteriota bacterium]|nr:phosphatidate cytidylyltransferase [Thermodesulfobacteriota bacterium]